MICVCNDVRTLASNTGLSCVKAPCLRSLGNLCFISEVRVQSDPEPGVLLIPFRREGSWPSKPLPPRTGVHSGWLTPMLPLPSRVSPSVIQNPCFAALSVTCILNPHLNDHSLFMFHVSYLFCLSFLVSFSLHHPEKKIHWIPDSRDSSNWNPSLCLTQRLSSQCPSFLELFFLSLLALIVCPAHSSCPQKHLSCMWYILWLRTRLPLSKRRTPHSLEN